MTSLFMARLYTVVNTTHIHTYCTDRLPGLWGVQILQLPEGLLTIHHLIRDRLMLLEHLPVHCVYVCVCVIFLAQKWAWHEYTQKKVGVTQISLIHQGVGPTSPPLCL